MLLELNLQRFAVPAPAQITIVFDSNISKVVGHNLYNGTTGDIEWTSSETAETGSAIDGTTYTFEVTLSDGYVIDSVTLSNSDTSSGKLTETTNTTFSILAGDGGINQTITITSKASKSAKETYIDLMSELANTINNLTGYSDSINLATIVERAKTITKPSGSYTVTANGTYDVTNYVSVVVNVPNPTLSGTAKANQVVKGATFYSDSYTLQTGTFEGLIPDGNAVAANVLKGKTFYGNGTIKLTGTIETYSGSTTITSNGTISVGGMYVSGNLTVNVPATPTQEKSVTITENGTTEVTPDSGKNLSKVTITTNVAGITEISTSSAMDAALVAANVGKYYKYTGTTDDKYTNGDIYQVESDE